MNCVSCYDNLKKKYIYFYKDKSYCYKCCHFMIIQEDQYEYNKKKIIQKIESNRQIRIRLIKWCFIGIVYFYIKVNIF